MFFELIQPGTSHDLISRWRVCVFFSCLLILAGLVAVGLGRGPKLGLDFAGGTEVQVRFVTVESSEGALREVASGLGIEGVSVVRYGEEQREFLIKFPGERRIAGAGESAAIDAQSDYVVALHAALSERIGALEIIRTEFVGPKVGAELRSAGLQAIGLACLLILIYIAFRFSLRFAPGAIIALLHDVLITSSLWVLLGREFDLRVLAAVLAIIGYSLNDTIIVYDRIRENLKRHTGHDLPEVLNRSVNQTLSRTLLTSLTTLGAVLALLLLGGDVVRPFALTMALGVVVGTYSSVYIAAPTLLWLERFFGAAEASGGRAK